MKSNDFFASILLVAGLVSAAMLGGCGGGGGDGSGTQPLPDSYSGVWERQGYGDILVIEGGGASFYEYTQNSCLLAGSAGPAEVRDAFGNLRLSQDATTLEASPVVGAVFDARFTRVDGLPAVCTDERLLVSATPRQVFEHFQQTFADYYAFFAERGVDWNAQVAEARLMISDDMDAQALAEVLMQCLAPIDDGHVQLATGNSVFRPVKARGANRVVEESFPLQTAYADIQAYADALNQRYWQNLFGYLDAQSINSVDGYLPDRLLWGTMENGRVGYLLISSMAYFTTDEDGLDTQANVDLVKALIPQVLADLADTEALIIDIRSNPGGQDEVALAIASHFIAQEQFVGAKFARTYMGEAALQEAWLQPAGVTYLKPVMLITGGETASAAEVFSLALRTQPQVTQIGEATAGMLSDVLEKALPNGWEVWLANEVYLDANGVVSEVSGIVPDITVATFSLASIDAGRNAALDLALTVLGIR